MNKTIREASTRLLALLPTHSSHYSIDDLIRAGFPEAVVERIQVDLADALTRSVHPPVTEWADMGSTHVQEAWHAFIDAIHTEVVLPRNRAAEIIDNAVIEVIEALVMPRRRLPELLFGLHRQLTLPQLQEKARYVTVHRVLVDALARYMQRKGLEHIDRNTAISVIETVDERYVASFTPLNWAQALDPLFKLAGSRVDPDLIRDYFIDKGRDDLAVRFEHLGYRVERSHLIELLSKPVLDEEMEAPPASKPAAPTVPPVLPEEADEGFDDGGITTAPPPVSAEPGNADQPTSALDAPPSDETADEPAEDPVGGTLAAAFMSAAPEEPEPSEPRKRLFDLFVGDSEPEEEPAVYKKPQLSEPEEEEPQEAVPVYRLFEHPEETPQSSLAALEKDEPMEQEEATEPEPREEEGQRPLAQRLVSLEAADELPMYQRYVHGDEPESGPEPQEEAAFGPDELPEPDEEDVVPENSGPEAPFQSLADGWAVAEEEDAEDDEPVDQRPMTVDGTVPIWQRFLSEVPDDEPEEEVTAQSTLFDALSVKKEEDDLGPAPAFGIPSYAETAPAAGFPPLSAVPLQDRGPLRGRLKKHEADIVSDIFGGNKTDYLQALQSLEMMEDWKQAQQYIKREVLPVANVDPYDEVFITFIDELQAYFTS